MSLVSQLFSTSVCLRILDVQSKNLLPLYPGLLLHFVFDLVVSVTLCFSTFFLCSESLPLPCNYSFDGPLPTPAKGISEWIWEIESLISHCMVKNKIFIHLSPLRWIQALSWSNICSRPLCSEIAIANVGGETPSPSILWTSLSFSLLHSLPIFSPLKWIGACEKSRGFLTQSASFLKEKELNKNPWTCFLFFLAIAVCFLANLADELVEFILFVVTQWWLYILRWWVFHIKSIDLEIYADSFSSFTCFATTTLSLYQNRNSMCGDNVTSILLMDEFQNSTEYLV